MKFFSIVGCVHFGNMLAPLMFASRFQTETNQKYWKHLFRFEDRNFRWPNLILGRKQQKPALANFI